MKNKNFGRKRQAIYILSNRKSTRIIKTLMDFFFFIKVKIKMVCFSVPSKMADGMIILPGDSKGNNEEKHSIQPMGSQFEQMSFLIFDAIVLKLMENWNQTSEQMFMRHADLE